MNAPTDAGPTGGQEPPEVPAGDDTTRARILRTATRLFATHGYEATGIRQIGREVGISSSVLYHYVGSKEDLLLGIMTEDLTFVVDKTRKMLELCDNPVDEVAGLVRAQIMIDVFKRPSSLVVDSEIRSIPQHRRAEIIGLRDEVEEFWKKAIADGIREGAFRHPHPSLARLAILGLATGVQNWYTTSGPLSLQEVCGSHALSAVRLLTGQPGVDAETESRILNHAIADEWAIVTSEEVSGA